MRLLTLFQNTTINRTTPYHIINIGMSRAWRMLLLWSDARYLDQSEEQDD